MTSRRTFIEAMGAFAAVIAGRLLPSRELADAASDWRWDRATLADQGMPAVLTVGQINERFLERLHDGLRGVRRTPLLKVSDVSRAQFGIKPGSDAHLAGVDLTIMESDLMMPLDSFDRFFIEPAAACTAERIKDVAGSSIQFGELELPSDAEIASRSTNDKSAITARSLMRRWPELKQRLLRFDVLVTNS